jgi:Ca2+-binding RTX toxin-like protein
LLLLAAPVAAEAATVSVSGGELKFEAGPGEANTGVIAQQTPTTFYVGDQNPAVTVTTSSPLACLDTTVPPTSLLGLPPGFLCTVAGATTLTMNLGDGNDTGVVNSTGVAGALNGGAGADQLVGGKENDAFHGDADSDTVAYAGINQTGLTLDRTTGVTATLPARGAGSTTNNGQGGENDTIHGDVEGLVGGNGNDTLTGSSDPDTIAGAVPAGTPLVVNSPAGVDTINGGGGADTLLAGDSGSVSGGPGADQIVGGRSTSATTVVHGNEDNDTIVSGLGDDDLFGDGGANTLAYASVAQGGLTVVSRGTNGVTARLPNSGGSAPGGRTGGAENDTIHDSFGTLVGGNGSDDLTGSDRGEVILGVAPTGTPGVVPGPPGNDILTGAGGVDVLLGNSGNDQIRSRDGLVESPVCGAGNDTVTADPADKPAADCETVDTGASTNIPGGVASGGQGTTSPAPALDLTRPLLSERPAVLVLRRGRRRVAMRLAGRNEGAGCRGTFTLKTRRRIRLGRRRAQRYTLARFRFRITSNRSRRFRVRLSRRTFQLVRRGRSIRLTGTAGLRDAAGNRATKTLRLRLNRR